MANLWIEDIRFLKDYFIEITLSNRHKIIYDIKTKLITARFKDLEDEELFLSGRLLDGNTICWSPGIELSLEEIMINISNRKS